MVNNAVIYARVSSENQRNNWSIEAQVESCRQYCADHELKPVRTFTDVASGKNLVRPGMTNLRAFLQAQEVSRVVVWRYNRISRDLKDLAQMLDWCQDSGVEIRSISEPVTGTPAMARLQVSMYGVVGQLERSLISENQSIAYHQKQAEGKALSAKVPLGYDWNRQHQCPVINEDDAAIVRFIFEAYIMGMGYRKLSDELDVQFNRTMPPQSIRVVLMNNRYTGTVKNEYGEVEGVYPQIVTPATFELAKQTRESRAKPRHSRPHQLKGKLMCPRCGHKMVTASPNGHNYYECTCQKPRFAVVMSEVEDTVWQLRRRILWQTPTKPVVAIQDVHRKRVRLLRRFEEGKLDFVTLRQRLNALGSAQALDTPQTQVNEAEGKPMIKAEFFDRIDHITLDEAKKVTGIYLKRKPQKNELEASN